ncbi:MAG: LpxL/LpxP family Kdo(2)-lipid IV(A) lauroyl/palmitoleoyl acyltransferase [Gammaproteobacteria bacterium]
MPDPELIPLRQFKAPRYWPTWAAISLMWLIARLPFPIQLGIGTGVGHLSYYLASSRRRICETNLRLCFPDLSTDEHRKLVRNTFVSNGIGLIEVGISWCRKPEAFRRRVSIEGLENLEQAVTQGKGVLLVCAHFKTLVIGGFLLSLFHKMDVTYRAHKNKLFDAFMFNGRKRLYPEVIERQDVRGAFRCLEAGHVVWYAPDQDYGPRRAVFVPFFGQPAATTTATSRFAAHNNSPVIFFSHYRNEDNSGYHLRLSQPLAGYPSGDDEKDARQINAIVEQAVRERPQQYLWLHKRFKTPLPGTSITPYNKVY